MYKVHSILAAITKTYIHSGDVVQYCVVATQHKSEVVVTAHVTCATTETASYVDTTQFVNLALAQPFIQRLLHDVEHNPLARPFYRMLIAEE